jgi:hypothetical protein
LHIINAQAGQAHNHMVHLNVPNPHTDKHAVELHIASHGLPVGHQVGVIFPAKTEVKSNNVVVQALALKDEHKALATNLKLDPTAVHVLSGHEGHFTEVPVQAGQTIQVGLVIQGGTAVAGTALHVTVTTRDGDTILGGSTFIVRTPAK